MVLGLWFCFEHEFYIPILLHFRPNNRTFKYNRYLMESKKLFSKEFSGCEVTWVCLLLGNILSFGTCCRQVGWFHKKWSQCVLHYWRSNQGYLFLKPKQIFFPLFRQPSDQKALRFIQGICQLPNIQCPIQTSLKKWTLLWTFRFSQIKHDIGSRSSLSQTGGSEYYEYLHSSTHTCTHARTTVRRSKVWKTFVAIKTRRCCST